MGRHINKAIRGIEGYLPVAADDLQGVAAHSIAGAPDFSISGVLSLVHSGSAKVCKDRPKVRAVCSSGLFIKEYRHNGRWRVLRYLFKTARPFRALLAAERLRECGIATPRVLLALEGGRCGSFSRDYLVTEALPEDTVFASCAEMPVRELAAGIMPMLVAMHDGGVAHGDLNLRNLYQRSGESSGYGDGYRWGVIDLDGCTFYSGGVPGRIRCREVARLATSVVLYFISRTGEVDDELLEFCDFCADCYLSKGGTKLNRLTYRRYIKIFMEHRKRGICKCAG